MLIGSTSTLRRRRLVKVLLRRLCPSLAQLRAVDSAHDVSDTLQELIYFDVLIKDLKQIKADVALSIGINQPFPRIGSTCELFGAGQLGLLTSVGWHLHIVVIVTLGALTLG